jgi:hypothetical protein
MYTSMSERKPKRIRRQVLGLRISPEPYYTLAEHTDTRLVLQSRPDANQGPGRAFMGCGALVMLITPAIIISLFIGGSQSPGDACFGSILSWPFAVIGFLGIISGRALATTINTITIDTQEQTIVYTQTNRVNRRRSQTLQLEQIVELRLRQRWYKPSVPFRPRQQVVALEIITDEGYTWLVDSAASISDVMPTATAMAGLLEVMLRVDDSLNMERQLPPSD